MRTCISDGHNAIGISTGIDGLIRGEFKNMTWEDVNGWVSEGGALLGTKRTLPAGKFKEIADQLKKHKIQVPNFEIIG